MNNSIARWSLATFFGGLLVLGQSPVLQQKLDRRGLIPKQYAYGDLYNMTNLPAYRETEFATNATVPLSEKPARKSSTVNLYIVGDSFTDIDTGFYAAAYTGHSWTGQKIATLQPANGRKQILIVQFIERVLQERLYAPHYQSIYIDEGVRLPGRPPTKATAVPVPWYRFCFGEHINERLEFLLFNFSPFLWLKEQKSQLVYTKFSRAGAGQLIDGKLFYETEASPTSRQSSFIPISDRQLDTLVTNLNRIRRHYLAAGLDEVYFSFIPNKATVFNYNRSDYNHQIERLESHRNLRAPLLSTIDTLRKHPDWYHLGDGHWNRNGKRYWIRRVNTLIADWHFGRPPRTHIVR